MVKRKPGKGRVKPLYATLTRVRRAEKQLIRDVKLRQRPEIRRKEDLYATIAITPNDQNTERQS